MNYNLPATDDVQFIDITNISAEMVDFEDFKTSTLKTYDMFNKYYELLKPPYKKIIFRYNLKGERQSVLVEESKKENELFIISNIVIMRLETELKMIVFKDGRCEYASMPNRYGWDKQRLENASRNIHYYIYSPAIFALALLNTKSVTLQEENNSSIKRILNTHKPNHKKKIIYKILKVNPLKAKNKSEQESIETGIKRTFHLCRGHFRTYQHPNLLFGKYEGTYYIEAHTRGNEEIGVTHKSYQLECN